MATYKVLQDIEAEDKFIGPLTLKQFIYASIAAACVYLSFVALTRNFGALVFFLLPFILIFGFLGWPWGRDQPTEVWLLAKIRFFIKPRRRIWDQTGMQELVEITAPKKDEKRYTDGLSQGEVRSRLRALADTLDSRGWAVKNVNVNLFAQPLYGAPGASDRLIDLSAIPQDVPNYEVQASDDILDTQNRVAQQLDSMMNVSQQTHRQATLNKLQQIRQGKPEETTPPNNYWFMHQAPNPQTGYASFDERTVAPGTPLPAPSKDTPDEKALLSKLKTQASKPKAAYGHMRVIDPAGKQPKQTANQPDTAASSPVTAPADPAILERVNNLALSNDLNVSTIARLANETNKKASGDDEVVVPLR